MKRPDDRYLASSKNIDWIKDYCELHFKSNRAFFTMDTAKHEASDYVAEDLSTMPTTFMRDDTGKTAWNLVDWQALEALVKVLEFGAAKYSPDNWKSCEDPMARIVPSLLRHAIAIAKGEEIDPESGLPHTGAIMCNAMFLEHFRLKGK